MRLQLLILTAALSVAIGAGVDAQPTGGRMGRGPGAGSAPPISEIVGKLDLSEDQTKAWEAIQKNLDETTRMSRARLRELRDQGAGPESEDVLQAREELQNALTRAESDLLDILDDEQKALYREAKKGAQSERGRGRGHGGRGGGPGRGY